VQLVKIQVEPLVVQSVTKKNPTPDMLLLTDSELLAPNFANFINEIDGEEPIID
jgi:hypothetical protein